MNQYQKAYVEAKNRMWDIEDARQAAEKGYIRVHKIKHKDGSIPKQLKDIDPEQLDDDLCQDPSEIVSHFWMFEASENLINEIETAKENLKKAEEALIAWGLSREPEVVADTMRKGIRMVPVYRTNFIQHFLEAE
jgi:hypothetical protein